MIQVKEIRKVYQVFQGEDIGTVEIRNGDEKISLTISGDSGAPRFSGSVPEIRPTEAPTAPQASAPQQDLCELKSGWVGFFIRLNPKTGENYLKLRDVVKAGDTVGHVRVLGVLQDLKAEKPGKLKEVLVEEGQPVEYGQPLMRFEIQ